MMKSSYKKIALKKGRLLAVPPLFRIAPALEPLTRETGWPTKFGSPLLGDNTLLASELAPPVRSLERISKASCPNRRLYHYIEK
jgi:hypothetical protein